MSADPLTIAALAYGAVLILGVVQGCRGRITVFADLQDLLISFSLLGGTAAAVFLIVTEVDGRPGLRNALLGLTIVAALVGFIYRARQQNRSMGGTALAVLTKLPFAAAVPLLAIQLVAPTGSTASARATRRASALLLLTLVAPLMLALVRDRNGLRRYLGVA